MYTTPTLPLSATKKVILAAKFLSGMKLNSTLQKNSEYHCCSSSLVVGRTLSRPYWDFKHPLKLSAALLKEAEDFAMPLSNAPNALGSCTTVPKIEQVGCCSRQETTKQLYLPITILVKSKQFSGIKTSKQLNI